MVMGDRGSQHVLLYFLVVLLLFPESSPAPGFQPHVVLLSVIQVQGSSKQSLSNNLGPERAEMPRLHPAGQTNPG